MFFIHELITLYVIQITLLHYNINTIVISALIMTYSIFDLKLQLLYQVITLPDRKDFSHKKTH